ncbi:MAG: hypothetical protein IT388_10445, partial [Nitrospirales bacterium]|nr:hypothetical protein [Nitrospirales bacterium]
MISYLAVLIIGGALFLFAMFVAFAAFKGSIEEVQYLRSLSEEDTKVFTDETVKDGPGIALLGAIIAGAIAAIIVGLYGVGPSYFNLGPLSVLAASVGITVCFFSDIRDKNEVRMRLVKKLHHLEKECAIP